MSQSNGQFDELGRLAAALCDGEITPAQAARLELLVSHSDAAFRYFVEYTQIHSALCHQGATSFGDDAADYDFDASAPVSQTRARGTRGRRKAWLYAALATSLLLALTVGVIQWYGLLPRDQTPTAPCVARVSGSTDAEWDAVAAPDDEGCLASGRQVVLRKGFAAIDLDGGARVVLQGPATFAAQSAQSAWLGEGRLTAHVPPEAAGFSVRTPTAMVVDQGTEFGVAVAADGMSDVEVFDGRVDVAPAEAAIEDGETSRHVLHRGEALRVAPAIAGGAPQLRQLAAGTQDFIRALPGSLARLRALVTAEPQLLHHYTFEGVVAADRCNDKRGDLHLREVGMRGGRDDGQLAFPPAWLEPNGRAFRPFRGLQVGNERGVALQSQADFRPPPAMTVELLVRFADLGEDGEGAVCAAIATRAGRRACGFFVTALEHGELACLLDAEAPWLKGDFAFVPGHWYYVAATFQTATDRETIVNAYASDLSTGERSLHRLLNERRSSGTAAAGPLGIGKGFDGERADAYPWSGELDEIAIYGAVLEERVLQSHLDALIRE